MSQNNSINILISNTGGPKGGSIAEATPEDFLEAFNSPPDMLSNSCAGNSAVYESILLWMHCAKACISLKAF
ncbi:MAG TPA: hypothetical protein VGP55_15620 [Chitinophagaceae bacterium]|nr:hypothetical protein [Chitinophagaceae bacterium]